jgi:hypothetical protein
MKKIIFILLIIPIIGFSQVDANNNEKKKRKKDIISGILE